MRSGGLRWTIAAALACLALAEFAPLFGQKSFLDDLNVNLTSTAGTDDEAVSISASFAVEPGGHEGALSITATMAPGYHIYSIHQPDGGPIRTKIKLDASRDFELKGEFEPDEPPAEHVDKVAFPGVPLEEHEGSVTWTAPIRFAESVDASNVTISGKVYSQACNAQHCDPPKDFPFTAVLAGDELRRRIDGPNSRPASAGKTDVGEYTADKQVMFRAHIEPKVVAPGGTARFVVTAEPNREGGWHIYAASDVVPEKGNRPTLIAFNKTSGLVPGRPVADVEPVKSEEAAVGYFDEPVTWTTELSVPDDAVSGKHALVGVIGYQTCTETACLQMTAVAFETSVTVGAESLGGRVPVTFTGKRSYDAAEKALKASSATEPPAPSGLDLNQIKRLEETSGSTSLWRMMLFGFAGGLILNLMPCVLPVIGLKVLSFIEQGGHDRRRTFLLNVWYSLGMLAVFMALATMPVVFRLLRNEQFGWGQQFAYDGFNITLAAVVFVMALSFLGVWEIPIPGFVGSGKVGEIAAQEGASGAFAKGVVTTVLATPCSGPFLGSALAFAFAQPALVTYTIFGCIGLGMASPYLAIGMFPGLVRWLPKPGAWMDTFKQTMGFVLLGTVVFILTFVRWESFVPTLSLLMGLWAACWWIGRTPLYAEMRAKLRAWTAAAVFATFIGFFSFHWLGPEMEDRLQRTIDEEVAKRLDGAQVAKQAVRSEDELPWEPYSLAALERYTAQGKTVIIDFTADWCLTCKTLERTVLNTARTRKYVYENGIVTMVGDVTRYPPETSELLEKLSGGRQVPVLAIFPASRPNEPIVLKDAYTPGLLFEKLKEAGPSKGAASASGATAMKTK
jgi:thiol:disulfide interchange protein